MNELGKFLRKFRIDRGDISLREMAEKLEISPSLLSSYETGRRDISDSELFFRKIVRKYRLKETERAGLRKAIDKSLKSYRIDLERVDPALRDQYVAFARKLPGFSAEDIEALGGLDDD